MPHTRSLGRRELLSGLAVAFALTDRWASAAPVSPIWSLAFSPDGKVLAAGGYRRVQLWDLESRNLIRTLDGFTGPVRALAWSPDGKRLAAGGGKPGVAGEVRLFSYPDLAAPRVFAEHKDSVEGLAFVPSGEILISGGVDEKAVPMQLADGKVIRPLTDHTNRVSAVAASPSGRFVVTGSLDRTIKIWSGIDFKPLANVDHAGGQVQCLAYYPTGDNLAAAGQDGSVRVYRVTEGRSGAATAVNATLQRTFGGNRTAIFALATAPKGQWLAAGGEDSTLQIFDGGNRRHLLREVPAPTYALAFSPDATLLASAGRDGHIRLWSTADGKSQYELFQP